MRYLLIALVVLASAVFAGQRAVYLRHHSVVPGAGRGVLLVADAAGVEAFWESRRGLLEPRPNFVEMRVEGKMLDALRLPEQNGSPAAAQDGSFELYVVGDDGRGRRRVLPEEEGVEVARRMMAPLPPELRERLESELLQPARASFARRKPVTEMRRELYPLLLGMDGFEGRHNVTWADGAVRDVKMVFTHEAVGKAFDDIPYDIAIAANYGNSGGACYAPVVYAVGEFSQECEVLCHTHGGKAPVLFIHSIFVVTPCIEWSMEEGVPPAQSRRILHQTLPTEELRSLEWHLPLAATIERLPGLYPVCGMNVAEGTATLVPASCKTRSAFSCRVVFAEAEQGAAFFTPEQEKRVNSCTQGAPALYLLGTYDSATNTLHALRALPNVDPRTP